jgi:chorismate mutase/prephenate dehydrogenase
MRMSPDDLASALEKIRSELDNVDEELIRLLARRLDLGLHAARIKQSSGLPILDSEREAKVLAQARNWARSAGLDESAVEDIIRRLISLSGRAQLDSTSRNPNQ